MDKHEKGNVGEVLETLQRSPKDVPQSLSEAPVATSEGDKLVVVAYEEKALENATEKTIVATVAVPAKSMRVAEQTALIMSVQHPKAQITINRMVKSVTKVDINGDFSDGT